MELKSKQTVHVIEEIGPGCEEIQPETENAELDSNKI